jgi:hypothetical protein
MTHHTARAIPGQPVSRNRAAITSRTLGLLPAKGAPSLKLSLSNGTLTGAPITHSPDVDHFALVTRWNLGGNDRFGTCGPTAVANTRTLIEAYLNAIPATFTDDQVFDLYRRSGNPTFDPNTGAGDSGVDMQTMCEALMSGGFAGVKPVCFAQVDASNLDDIRACVEIFGSVMLGVTLDSDQNAQTNAGLWSYSPSPVWGGHAIASGRYSDPSGLTADRTGVITWQLVVDATDDFLTHQCDQVWVTIWPEHLGTVEFQQGVNLSVLEADYVALTGKPFPVVPGPTPAPVPVPPGPTPGGVPTGVDLALAHDLHAWMTHPNRWGRAAALRKSAVAWLNQEEL